MLLVLLLYIQLPPMYTDRLSFLYWFSKRIKTYYCLIFHVASIVLCKNPIPGLIAA